MTNGDLPAEAERTGFDVLLTADNNMRYQQNLKGRRIALLVRSTAQRPRVQMHFDKITAALKSVQSGSYTEIEIPYST